MLAPKAFYYITHIDNLRSILKRGILSYSQVGRKKLKKGVTQKKRNKEEQWSYHKIHDEGVMERRGKKTLRNRSLWDYVNLYFEARNPMFFRVIHEKKAKNIVVLQVNPDVIEGRDVGITDGNAAAGNTTFFENIEQGLHAIDSKVFEREWWDDSTRRKFMAELLVYDSVPPDKILGIFVPDAVVAKAVDLIVKEEGMSKLSIISDPHMFFLPEYRNQISHFMSLVKGDMFFSRMQTLTISVNTVGVMGKGLASRAKYQFPDVYVQYQDFCKQKKLKIGIPYLFKREGDFEFEDENRWFLLFPTKRHWRDNSSLEWIEQGLRWLRDNYKRLEIRSLAIPALGCGLGKLDWGDVGPLMCRYLYQMDIQSCIYLPTEKSIPVEQLKSQFLLKDVSR